MIDEELESRYVTFKVTPYALTKFVHSLCICGITHFCVTKEDGQLILVIPYADIKASVYPLLNANETVTEVKDND